MSEKISLDSSELKYNIDRYASYFKTNLKHLAYESVLQARAYYLL